MAVHVEVEPIPGGLPNCPYCKSVLRPGEAKWTCPRCATVLHAECLKDNKGCTSLGCEAAVPFEPERPRPREPFRWPSPWPAFELGELGRRAIMVVVGVGAVAALVFMASRVIRAQMEIHENWRQGSEIGRSPEPHSPTWGEYQMRRETERWDREREAEKIRFEQREVDRQLAHDREVAAEERRRRGDVAEVGTETRVETPEQKAAREWLEGLHRRLEADRAVRATRDDK